jgi:preprotein translocase subunit SecG
VSSVTLLHAYTHSTRCLVTAVVIAVLIAEGGSSGSGGEGGGKMPEMNVSANLMLATTLMGAVFVYQVCVVMCWLQAPSSSCVLSHALHDSRLLCQG